MTLSDDSARPDPSRSAPGNPAFVATLAAARSGDKDAMERLFGQFYERVEQQVHRALTMDLRRKRPWLSTRFSTGDVVQEVFRSVLTDLKGFTGQDEASFQSYLTSIVRNRLFDIIRHHEAHRRDGRRTKPSESQDAPSPHDGPPTDAIAAENRRIYDEVLRTFPERDQALLRGRLEEQREFNELQEQLEFSSMSATQRAFYNAQARLVIRLRQRQAPPTQ